MPDKCPIEKCKRLKYLRHDYCDRHWLVNEIIDRWDAYAECPDRLEPLKRLAVHPADWTVMGMPLHYSGLPVKVLGLKVEDALEMRRAA